MKRCLIFKNLFKYDPVLPIPLNFPTDTDAIYITDNDEYKQAAEDLGWKVYVIDKYKDVSSLFEKRKVISLINCFPERVIPELLDYDYIFICDSNVRKLDSNYKIFVNLASSNKALYVTSGFWKHSHENTISACLNRSLGNSTWRYNHKEIKENTLRYLQELSEKGIPPSNQPVVSAKYIGWNIKHPNKDKVADLYYAESMKHLQGNIILSYLLHLFPDDIEHYRGFQNDGVTVNHKLHW